MNLMQTSKAGSIHEGQSLRSVFKQDLFSKTNNKGHNTARE